MWCAPNAINHPRNQNFDGIETIPSHGSCLWHWVHTTLYKRLWLHCRGPSWQMFCFFSHHKYGPNPHYIKVVITLPRAKLANVFFPTTNMVLTNHPSLIPLPALPHMFSCGSLWVTLRLFPTLFIYCKLIETLIRWNIIYCKITIADYGKTSYQQFPWNIRLPSWSMSTWNHKHQPNFSKHFPWHTLW